MGLVKINLNKKIIVFILCFMVLSPNLPAFAADPVFINTPATINQEDQEKDKTNNYTTQLRGSAVMIDINSDKLEYFEEQNQFVATGSAEVIIPEQNSKLEAKKIIFDQIQQQVTAEGDVKITKNGKVIHGEYAKIDLDKESALISEPYTTINQVKITANTANVYPKSLEALKGKVSVDNKDLRLLLTSGGYFPGDTSSSDMQNADIDPNSEPTYKIVSKEIIIDSKQNLNVITLKNATVWIGKVKIASIPSLTLSTDKDIERIETMLPEIGHTTELGTYFGPSHVFYMPNGATLKMSPVMSFGDGIGGGAIARFKSDTNKTELGYTTNMNKFVLNGEQSLLTPNTRLLYGTNSYMDDGYLNYSKAKYLLELVDDRKLASAFNFDLYSRLSAGYAQDYASVNYYNDNPGLDYWDSKNSFGTARFRIQGNLINNKPVFQVQDDLLQLRLQSQFGISAYGTGETVGIVRAGPRLDSRIGPVRLSTTYFQAGVHGESPLMFDRYMHGKSNWLVSGDVKLHRYLNVGHLRSLNLTKDNWEGRLSTENLVYARVGPDDVKFRLGYDFVRRRSTFGIDLLLGSGKSALEFDKLRANDLE
ncbi:MAG: hypothetical protein A2104_10305 [Candidatus Melainabacteria bacterium GWF2_32_7]|nr:MAG: hypothetical protein A2104_10305 [Candidatus Melainabacteria bacterium GWF2_32_7]